MSHIDYANSLLINLPSSTLKVLQNIQNLAAKLVLKRSKYSSNKEALRELHWLPVTSRIKFKLLCLVHKCLHGKAPKYLKELITLRTIKRTGLRSNKDHQLLIVPKTIRKTFADRSFSVAGPKLWNSLPNELRIEDNHEKFRKNLKTFLFCNPDL